MSTLIHPIDSSILFSVIIPARDEEKFIGKCLDSIVEASQHYEEQVEVIVAINRCTDRTEEIARSYGTKICHVQGKNLAAIRNAAAKHARGQILVTIDADSTMTPDMFKEIEYCLKSGKYIGGGVRIRLERISLGIFLSVVFLALVLLRHRVSAGLFWCFQKDFWVIGGFDESLVSGEDINFAKRLRSYGKSRRKRFKTIIRASICTSCRKWDKLGDWYLLKNLNLVRTLIKGKNQAAANRFYYDIER